MDADDLELFERTLQAAAEGHTGAELDAALDDLGWREALDADPRAAISTLFEQQGRAGATSSALDHVVATGLGVEARSGVIVVLPAIGEAHPPGAIDGKRLTVAGLVRGAVTDSTEALVVATDGDGARLVRVATAALQSRPVRGMDPWLGLVEVTGRVAAHDPSPVDWTSALARAQLAVGHELVGASRKMLDLAGDHARERVQFGRPIASFQAIRHRLADALVAVEAAAAVLDAAWDDGSPATAAMAKAMAGRGARTVARHAQQVLAGIGFTTEHVLHRFVRRVLVLDQLLGASRSLTRDLGDQVLTQRRLPPLLPL